MRLNLKKVIGSIAFAAILLLLVGRFLTIVAGVSFPMSVVSSNSMSPALFEGDVVPWIPCGIEDVKEGDVIVFKSATTWNGEKLIVHRVVEVKESENNGKIMLITKGDANNYTDQRGPHIPEAPITDGMLEGKLISIGKQPLKIPFVGYPWLWMQDAFKELSRSIVWGKPQSEMHYVVFIPLALSTSLLIGGAIIWAPENGKSLKEKLRDHIFGPERLSFKRLFVYSFIFYIILLLIASSFSYDRLSTSLGVNEKTLEADISFGYLQENESSFPRKVSIVNPSLLPVKGFLFSSGNISRFIDYGKNAVFKVEKGEKSIGNATAIIPKGTKPGIYTGNIYIYSSPFWNLLPSSLIHASYTWSPRGSIILLSLFSAFLLSIFTCIFLIIVSKIVDEILISRGYFSWLSMPLHIKIYPLYKFIHSISYGGKIKNKVKNAFAWLNGEMHWVEFGIKKPLIASFVGILVALPFLIDFNNFIYLIFISSSITGIAAYALGCRWRGEIMCSALLTTTWISSLFALKSFSYIFQTNHSLLVPFSSVVTISGILLFLFAIMAVPACLLSWLPGYLIHSIREKRDCMLLLEGCDL